ncbi:MAG: hypothetical protein ACLVAW_19255 [Eisenbergiella massiliensis]
MASRPLLMIRKAKQLFPTLLEHASIEDIMIALAKGAHRLSTAGNNARRMTSHETIYLSVKKTCSL